METITNVKLSGKIWRPNQILLLEPEQHFS